LSPPVTSLAAALLTALVAEPASRPAGKAATLLHEQEPPAQAGGFSGVPGRARDQFPEPALQVPWIAYGRMAQRQQLLRAVTSRNKDIAFRLQ
jgi:hypothetical protein